MASNDFLPFATGSTANVLSQPAYAALPAVATGYQSGVAQSAALNKTWRQSSIMAAVLAQFIADQSGANSVDDGTTATLESNLLRAIRNALSGSSYVTDTGTANTYLVAYTPPIAGIAEGSARLFKVKTANTGASTLQENALPAEPLVGSGGQPLQGGELVAGGTAAYTWNASLASYVLLWCTGAPEAVAAATKSQHAMQLGQATGRLAGAPQVFPIPGTFTYTRTPGTTFTIFEVQGGSGAGAGITVPSAGNVSCGAPGASGSYGLGMFTAAAIGVSQSITVGVAGVAAAGANGGNGGTSSVGALMSAPGGPGGAMLNNQVPATFNGNGVLAGSPVGANIHAEIGTCPDFSFGATSTGPYGGPGGPSRFGNGGNAASTNSSGVASPNFGAGGGGTGGGSGSGVLSGGAGKGGIVIAWEYF